MDDPTLEYQLANVTRQRNAAVNGLNEAIAVIDRLARAGNLPTAVNSTTGPNGDQVLKLLRDHLAAAEASDA